jgi:hypothetical protein
LTFLIPLIYFTNYPPISTVTAPGGPIAVVTGTPVTGFTPVTWLVTRAAGLLPIRTVTDPIAIAPEHAAPETTSPTTAAGRPAINTVGTPGGNIASPVKVRSPIRAAGKLIEIHLLGLIVIQLLI